MKDKIREMLESIVPHPIYGDFSKHSVMEALEHLRMRVINVLADGAEIMYSSGVVSGYQSIPDDWCIERMKDNSDKVMAIRLKPQPIERKVTKMEILNILLGNAYDEWNLKDLASRIERYGVKDGE